MDERGKFENDIRSKLYDFEVETKPEDWETIAGRLAGGKSVRLHRHRRYLYAAASVAALMLLGGLYRSMGDKENVATVAVVDDSKSSVDTKQNFVENKIENKIEEFVVESRQSRITEKEKSGRTMHKPDISVEKRDTILFDTVPPVRVRPLPIEELDSVTRREIERDLEKSQTDKSQPQENPIAQVEEKSDFEVKEKSNVKKTNGKLFADASKSAKSRRRWGFGFGGGSVGTSSSGDASNFDFRVGNNSAPLDENDNYRMIPQAIELRNGVTRETYEEPHGNVKHKRPISAGFGISYRLNDRWSLQSGLVYSLLRSEWTTATNATYAQRLHFVGIPLSAAYKIAEYKKLDFYAAAGGMVEKNIAGSLKYKSGTLNQSKSEDLKMQELMWSLNARLGVNYPIWRFVNVYAEFGTNLYFDNKSYIKTIRSDKPFNVSLQAGFRLGF